MDSKLIENVDVDGDIAVTTRSLESNLKRKGEKQSLKCSYTENIKIYKHSQDATQTNFKYIPTSREIQDLQQCIFNENVISVEKFIQKYPFECYASNDIGQSAVATALKFVKPSIYELLITNGFRLESHEDFNNIMDNLPENATENKFKIFEIDQKFAVESKHEHLIKIRSKCRLHHTTPKENRCKYFWKIMTALKELDKIPEVSIIMEILVLCRKLQIIFDFSHESVDHIDPKKNKGVLGSTHPSVFCITIGAKLLLDKNECFEVFGTMAHEFCHYAMNLMFANDCKPYKNDDKESEKEFEGIVDDYSKRKITEEIVALAFQKENFKKRHAELIVRVPHVLALYRGCDGKIKELRDEFREIFKFYDELMMKLKVMMPDKKAEVKVNEINEICGISSKFQNSMFRLKDYAIDNFEFDMESKNPQAYASNCVELTIKAIHDSAVKLKKLKFLIFAKLEHFENEKITKEIFDALQSFENVSVIVECDEIDTKMIDEMIKILTINQKFVFVSNKKLQIELIESKEVNHLCSELTENSQENLLKTMVNFQGLRLELNEIWSQNLESVESFPLNELSKNEEIKIGEEIKFEDIHLERKFIASDAQWDWKKQKYDQDPISTDEIIGNSKIFVLSDLPGNGKSTEFKFLASKLKQKYQNHYILLIDLKKHTKSFKKDSENSSVFFVEGIANFLADKILKLKNFHRKVFIELFKINRVVVLMDGVDEISPNYDNFVMNIAVGIKEMTKNQLFIATRPHLTKEIEQKLNIKAWKLREFSKEEQKSFFKEIFLKHNSKFEDFRENIETFINKIEQQWKTVFNTLQVTNPLLLQIIAELFIDDPKFQVENSNLYKIYHEFVKKMFKRLLTKGSEAEDDMVQFMRKLKIQEFHKKVAVREKLFMNEFNHLFKDLVHPSDDQLNRVGLMFNIGDDDFDFIHETFQEFFIAETILDKVFKMNFNSEDELKECLEILIEVMRMSVILKFLNSALENFKIDQNSENSKILMNAIKSYERLDFTYVIMHKCNNLLFTLCTLITDNEKVVKIWLKIDTLGKNVLMIAFGWQKLEEIQELWKLIEEFFTKNQIKKLLSSNRDFDNVNKNCFTSAIQNEDEKTFEYFLELADKKLNHEEKEILINYRSFDWIDVCKHGSVKLVLIRIKKFISNNYENFLRNLTDNFFNRICKQNAESIKFLCNEIIGSFGSAELKVILRKSFESAKNILMNAAENREDPEVFETLIDFIEDKNQIKMMLLQEDNVGRNVLNISCRFGNTEMNKKVVKIYEKYFKIEELKEIFIKKDEEKKTLLEIAASLTIERFELIWSLNQKLFDDEFQKKMLIKSFENIKCYYLYKFMPFIFKSLTVDDYPEIFPKWLESANELNQYEWKRLLATVDAQENFADVFYEKLFKFQDKNNKIINDYAKDNEDKKVLEMINHKKELVLKSSVKRKADVEGILINT